MQMGRLLGACGVRIVRSWPSLVAVDWLASEASTYLFALFGARPFGAGKPCAEVTRVTLFFGLLLFFFCVLGVQTAAAH